tara:strand:+ start:6220 stop:7590 length:1371 start_codon:yes stop_codon:yes gene_type:complete
MQKINMSKNIESGHTTLDVPGVFHIDKKGACPCVICLDPIQEDSDVAILKCGHRFHASCLLESAVSGNDRCALCRMTVGKKPESRPDLTAPLANIFIQNEFNQLSLGQHMTSFCENLSPEAKEKWSKLSTGKKIEMSGDIIDTFRVFGMRLCRQIYTWINEGDSRMHIPEEAQMDQLSFPSWSFGVYSSQENDDESGDYDDMPSLMDDDEEESLEPIHFSIEQESFASLVLVTNIQRIMRGYLQRRKYKFLLYKKWMMERILLPKLLEQIISTQAVARGYIERKKHHCHLMRSRGSISAVIRIQRMWRDYIHHCHIMRSRICMGAAIHIQRIWRGYFCRYTKNNNDFNAINSYQSIIINSFETSNTENSSTIDIYEEFLGFDNARTRQIFLDNSGLPEDIKSRIVNNYYLSNFENLMYCDIETIMWPPGSSGTRSLFSREEANDIFRKLILYQGQG